MARKRGPSRKHHLFYAVGIILLGASVAPLVYCMGWEEATTFGQCMDAHRLPFPTAIFSVGLLSLLAGVVTQIYVRQEQEKQEREQERLDRAVQMAKKRAAVRTPLMDKAAMRGRREELPEAIEVDESLEFAKSDEQGAMDEEQGDSVMAFLQETKKLEAIRRQRSMEEDSAPESGDFYVPPGMEKSPVLYLATNMEPTPVTDSNQRVNNPALPYEDVNEALRHAFQLVLERGRPVVVRAEPGVYQAAVEIPDRVCLINHRLPASMTVRQRLRWLRSQEEIDHPERVTILAPVDSAFGVRLQPGKKQGIFGCWIVGRPGVEQTGLCIRDSVASAVVNCAFESFANGGAEVRSSGEELEGRAVQFAGCLWHRNRRPAHGGALRIEKSVVRVEGSIFDSNRAPRGGAIAVVESDKPFVMNRCVLYRNRALAGENGTSPLKMEQGRWQECEGLGGALWVRKGLARVVNTNFDGNDATFGGGALASVGSRVVVKSSDGSGICGGNRADVGGAIFCVGWSGTPAMVRVIGGQVTKNLAKSIGGGLAAMGTGVLHLEDVKVETNRAAGERRGFGGGVAVFRGGTAQICGGEVSSNRVLNGGGGGVAAVNGALRMAERCFVTDNQADHGGGGVLAITAVDRALEILMGEKGYTLPLKIKIEDIRITSNRAGGDGGGLRAGNLQPRATFPLTLTVEYPHRIRGNEAKVDRRNAQNLWIEWGGKLQVNDDAPKRVELALK